jgi:hypothetical protein
VVKGGAGDGPARDDSGFGHVSVELLLAAATAEEPDEEDDQKKGE